MFHGQYTAIGLAVLIAMAKPETSRSNYAFVIPLYVYYVTTTHLYRLLEIRLAKDVADMKLLEGQKYLTRTIAAVG